ncbi:MAG TPA: HEAT repeat domain-containing protein [Gemmataceae bacterium]|jgi:HEAT repeat protein|nr:HEAT repeat domain-containing protein [Gemmataceae bacterium]
MQLLRIKHKASWRSLAFLSGMALLFFAGLSSAAPFPPDPVDELRGELGSSLQDLRFRFPELARKLEGLDADKERPILNQKRENLLMEKIAALRTIPQMRRALMLNAWRLEEDRDEMAPVDRKVRQALVERLQKQVRSLLQQGNVTDQLAVINIIAEMGPSARNPEDKKGIGRDFGPDLAELMKEGHPPAVRAAAARALGQIFPEPKLAGKALGDLLASGDVQERRAAAEGLLGLVRVANQLVTSSEAAGRVFLSKTAKGAQMDRTELGVAGKAALSVAGKGLFDPDPGVRRLCAETFRVGATALTNAIPQRSSSEGLSRGGLEVEAIQAARTELQPLMEAFKEQAANAARALTSNDRHVRLLMARTVEELAQARSLYERALSDLPPRPAAGPGDNGEGKADGKPLPTATQKPVPEDRDGAVSEALRRTISALAKATADPSPQVRLSAIEALETIGPEAESTAPVLVKALKDDNLFVRWAAARALGKVGTRHADIAVPGLAKLLDDRDFDVNIAAAQALERFGPAAAAALPQLEHALAATDAEKRKETLRAIESIGSGASPAIPAITQTLNDSDHMVRQQAARLLGRFGPAAAQATTALRRALQDPEPEVRRAASDALLNIEGR